MGPLETWSELKLPSRTREDWDLHQLFYFRDTPKELTVMMDRLQYLLPK